MTSRTATTALLLGMTLEQAQDALARPVEGECFFLGGHCGLPTEPGDWLCPEHRAWRPNLGGPDAPAMQCGSAPRLREVQPR